MVFHCLLWVALRRAAYFTRHHFSMYNWTLSTLHKSKSSDTKDMSFVQFCRMKTFRLKKTFSLSFYFHSTHHSVIFHQIWSISLLFCLLCFFSSSNFYKTRVSFLHSMKQGGLKTPLSCERYRTTPKTAVSLVVLFQSNFALFHFQGETRLVWSGAAQTCGFPGSVSTWSNSKRLTSDILSTRIISRVLSFLGLLWGNKMQIQFLWTSRKGEQETEECDLKTFEFQINITIHEGQQLAGLNIDPVVKVQIGEEVKYTSIKQSTNCPYFNEVCPVFVILLFCRCGGQEEWDGFGKMKEQGAMSTDAFSDLFSWGTWKNCPFHYLLFSVLRVWLQRNPHHPLRQDDNPSRKFYFLPGPFVVMDWNDLNNQRMRLSDNF